MLTKSYIESAPAESHDTLDEHETVYAVWDEARREGHVGEFVNLQTNERITSLEILNKADLYAAGLLSLGLEQGEDCISMIGCLSMRTLSVWAGCLSVGIGSAHTNVYVPRDHTIESFMGVAKPKVIVVGDGCDEDIVVALAAHFDQEMTKPSSITLPWVQQVYYEGTNLKHLERYAFMQPLENLIQFGNSVTKNELRMARDSVKPHHTSHIYFTCGSTGVPKCAQLDQRYIAKIAAAEELSGCQSAMIAGYNTDAAAAPIRSLGALGGKLKKIVIGPDRQECHRLGEVCGEAIIAESVELIKVNGNKLEAICDYIKDHHHNKHPVKAVSIIGQTYSRLYRDRLLEDLGDVILMTLYGLSECLRIGKSPILAAEREDLMDGKLIAHRSVEVLRLVSDGEIVDIGEVGEIEVKSSMTFKGYRGDEKKTMEMFTSDGFLKTGDTAVMHEDGKFQIKGRTSDAIRFKVERQVVWPSVIEHALSIHPNIRQIQVISEELSDEDGDEIVYCIRLEKGADKLTADLLIEYCESAGLSRLEFPKRVLYFDKFPRTANHRKVDLMELKKEMRRRITDDPDVGRVEAVDVDIYDDEKKLEISEDQREMNHIKVIHLDEEAILKQEVEKTENSRMITMLIAIPATVFPACCCIWLCRRFCDPKSRVREAVVKYAPGIEEDSRGDIKYREVTNEEQEIMDSAPERFADVGKGGGKKRMRGFKKALRKRSPKKMMRKIGKGIGKRLR